MDWAKAKTIMIIALLVTNLILILSYGILKDPDLQKNNDRFLTETIKLLERNKIYLNTPIPDEQEKMPVLFVKHDQYDETRLENALENQAQVSKEGDSEQIAKSQADALLTELDWMDKSVVFDRVQKVGSRYQVLYRNQVDELPLEESWMKVTVGSNGVTQVDRNWLLPLGYGEGRKEIISAATALLKLIQEKDPSVRMEVEQIQLVYWLDPSGFGAANTVSDTAFPAWKITDHKGETRYVNAYQE